MEQEQSINEKLNRLSFPNRLTRILLGLPTPSEPPKQSPKKRFDSIWKPKNHPYRYIQNASFYHLTGQL